jgi:hypothetical protein
LPKTNTGEGTDHGLMLKIEVVVGGMTMFLVEHYENLP